MSQVFAHEISKRGGSWLATARRWVQSNINHGDTVRWGSGEPITMSVSQFEDCASFVAAAAINDDRAMRPDDPDKLRTVRAQRAQLAEALRDAMNCIDPGDGPRYEHAYINAQHVLHSCGFRK